MGSFVEAAKTSEFAAGTKKKVLIQGQEILLAKVGDSYYAIGNRCSHMGGDLSAGKLDGTIITCPRHGSQFDVRDGTVIRWMKGSGLSAAVGKALKSPRAVPKYNVRVEGDTISIEV
jgi:3-phenylpropionate/trans-cinnamate dioxygenase ferredoxin subunit